MVVISVASLPSMEELYMFIDGDGRCMIVVTVTPLPRMKKTFIIFITGGGSCIVVNTVASLSSVGKKRCLFITGDRSCIIVVTVTQFPSMEKEKTLSVHYSLWELHIQSQGYSILPSV